MIRRDFLAASALGIPGLALTGDSGTGMVRNRAPGSAAINFAYDGYMYTPEEYIGVLVHISDQMEIEADWHAVGGVVAQVEERMKEWTGMEDAIFMPSGTMANNLSIRVISQDRHAIFVPERSHILNSEGDSAQVLHQKVMVPIAPGEPYFSLDQLVSAIDQHKARSSFGYNIGAISMEIAGRLVNQRTQGFEEMKEISFYARANGIPIHLDGARVHSAAAYTGVSVKQYCELFDTVYMDLYKYFRATSGAVLCGPTSVISQMKRFIKMCGGSLLFNWPNAAVAYYYMQGFEERFQHAKTHGEKIIQGINELGEVRVTSFNDGTNVFLLDFGKTNPRAFAQYLERHHNIMLRMGSYDADSNTIPFKVNETQLQASADDTIAAFKEAVQRSL
jgi:threonine aldolase